MARAGGTLFRAPPPSPARRVAERARGVDHVVEEEAAPLAGTSPMRCITSADVDALAPLVDDRRRSREALGVGRARSTPPASGETTTDLARPSEALSSQCSRNTGVAHQVVERDVEEALDLAGVQVDARRTRSAPRPRSQVGHQLRAEIGVRGGTLRSWRA